jgi:hypothetical protein
MENSLLPVWTEDFVPRGLLVQPFSLETAHYEVKSMANDSCYDMHALTVAPVAQVAPNHDIAVRSAAENLSMRPQFSYCKPVQGLSFSIRLDLLRRPEI